ncbi:hypothetical protein BKE38_28520 [Pseudoroseomonas deserti]|uniref:Uncharacterized protein n=1 Tax=Teichococcus deserti TaxID=1817963 RepID=A0A1V2GTU1_9PROT|nr:hypothetical protein [Pseudoroseomonas deserti]ONG43983.1 hypothetical protein BKE38_28520 [Pseudoroseomonas deserti]
MKLGRRPAEAADDTIRLPPGMDFLTMRRRRRRNSALGWAGATVALAAVLGAVVYVAAPHLGLQPAPAGPRAVPLAAAPPPAAVADAPRPAEPPPPVLRLPLDHAPPPRAPGPPRAAPPLLREAEIAAHRPQRPTLLRLVENPRIFVLDFPDLASQGTALNRIAALVEKAATPRDRVLTEAELAAVLARSGERAETFYYGHDYRGSDLARFFALAARDRIALNASENWVAEQLAAARHAEPSGEIAVISIVAPGGEVDEAARRTTLRHEIGHGHDFTLPFYAAHVRRVWGERLADSERAGFRAFLAREGYDTRNADLMAGEMQAYLLFTPDARFFNPRLANLTEAQADNLRAMLLEGGTFQGLPLDPADR